MGLEDIRNELDWIDRKILEYSVDRELGLRELEEMLEELYRLKEQFLSMSFLRVDIEDLEVVRFNLVETIYSIRIIIKEKQGMDASEEIIELRQLEMEGEIYEQR